MLRALGVDPKDFIGSNNNKDDWSQLSTEEKRKLLFGDNKQ